MAIYRLECKNISRGAGRSAVASAAYASSSKIESDYDGQIRDFEKKSGVLHSQILLPDYANSEYYDRGKLWNQVEKVETASNARLAKELVLALPHEFSLEQNIDLVERFAKRFVHDYGVAVDYSIHDGNKDNDGKNKHVHLQFPNRPFGKSGEFAQFKRRSSYALDAEGNKIPEIDPKTGQQKIGARGRKMWKRVYTESNPLDDKKSLEKWRADWAFELNMALSRAGVDEVVDHRSYEKQGIDKIPQYKEGVAATALRRRGKLTKVAQMNEQIQLVNCFRSALYRRDGEPRYTDKWDKRVWKQVEKQEREQNKTWAEIDKQKQEQEQKTAQAVEQKPKLDYKHAIQRVGATEVRRATKKILGDRAEGLQLRDLTNLAKLLEFEENRNGVQALPPAQTLSEAPEGISGLDWLLMNQFQRDELESKRMRAEI